MSTEQNALPTSQDQFSFDKWPFESQLRYIPPSQSKVTISASSISKEYLDDAAILPSGVDEAAAWIGLVDASCDEGSLDSAGEIVSAGWIGICGM